MPSNTAPSFATRGTSLTDLTGRFEYSRSVLLQPDGQVLVVGHYDGGFEDSFLVSRFHADGTLDTSFGFGGSVRIDLGFVDHSEAALLQPDGRIVIVGRNFGGDFVAMRLNADGIPDTTFNGTGIVQTDFAGWGDTSAAVALQSDGRIVVGGASQTPGTIFAHFALARYNADGSLDASFGVGGKVITDLGFVASNVQTLAVQPDGKIVAAGYIHDAVSGFWTDFAIVRYNADGTLDASFGAGGQVITPVHPNHDRIESVVLQADGKIFVGGGIDRGGFQDEVVLARYNSNGTLDASFNGDGIVTLSVDARSVRQVVVQPDGRILFTADSGGFVVGRLNADGSLDTSFGGDGIVRTAMRFFGGAGAYSLALHPDGKITVVGDGGGPLGAFDVALARYNPDGSLDPTFGTPVNTLDGATHYNVGGTPVRLDLDVEVFDAELYALGSYDGARLTIARAAGANDEDHFFGSGSLGALVEGGAVVYDGVVVGTVTTNSHGTLQLTFNAAATQPRVNGVMQSIAYGTFDDQPTEALTFQWTFSDANSGGQGDGGPMEASGFSTVFVFNPTILWSSLPFGGNPDFVLGSSVLRFDDPSISAADVRFEKFGDFQTLISYDGINVILNARLAALTSSSIVFDDGSVFAVGDDTFDELQDSVDNTLSGGAKNDQLRGLIGDDTLHGGGGNDYLDGGDGGDTMRGGMGDDVYVVDDVGGLRGDTSLRVTGAPGNPIYQGSLNLTPVEGEFIASVGDADGDGLPDTMGATFIGSFGTFSVVVATYEVGLNLEPGFYGDARGFGQGRPVLMLQSNLGGGASTEFFGNFTINYVQFNFTELLGFSVSFEQHNDTPDSPPMTGTFNYFAPRLFAPDRVIELANQGTDTVRTFVDYTLPDHVENLVLVGTALRGTGNGLANLIMGNDFANVLDGGAGVDTLIGGLGDDTYIVNSTQDSLVEIEFGGTDTVESSVTYSLGAELENLTLTGGAAINGTGNALDNVLIGNSAVNVLKGMAGNDTYVVGAGDEVEENADEGMDLVQAAASYTLGANVENLMLLGTDNLDGTGNALANVITGNSGNNTLDGRGGGDTLVGGIGDDTYVVDSSRDMVVEDLFQGTDLVRSSVTHALAANVENLTLTGTGAINGIGNDVSNVITGNSGNNRLEGLGGNDTLDGRGGADTMAGGAHDDMYFVDNAGDRVIEAANQGADTVHSTVSLTLAANVEHLVLTGSAALNGTGNALDNALTGNAARNVLTGGDGNDVLDGRGGADRMVGGRGNDKYFVERSGDEVVEQANQGTDTVVSSITYTLANHLENLTLTGTAALDGTGNELDNEIIGNSGRNRLVGGRGNDLLDGRAGADTMVGGRGDDTYVVDRAGDVVTEQRNEGIDTIRSAITYTLGANFENLTLLAVGGAINGTGNARDNVIVGNGLTNTLLGEAGDDVLDDGGSGADILIGGTGNDIYIVRSPLVSAIRESANEGRDLVRAAVNLQLAANVEDLTLIGFALEGKGNALANVITGNEFDNMLDGAAGRDEMRGGLGNDTYVVDNARDEVIERAGQGTDTVRTSISYTLAAHVEKLVLTGSAAIDGTGNNLDNEITGNGAANTLRGDAGNDTLDGAGGADTLRGGRGGDTYIVDHARDRVFEERNEGTDLVRSSVTHSLADNVENLTLTGLAAINGTGNALDNVIIGNDAANRLDGGAGNDFLDGGLGMDTMRGGRGNDTYVVTEGDYSNVPTVLSLRGEPGQSLVLTPHNFTPLDGQFFVQLGDGTGDGIVDALLLRYFDSLPSGGNWYDLYLSTYRLGTNFEPAAYPDARSDLFGAFGVPHAGLDLLGNGVAFGEIVGSFTIRNLAVDYGGGAPVLQSLSVDFEQRYLFDPTLPGVSGRFNYNFGNGTVVPETVIELANEGTDTVRSSLDYVLPANVENLVLLGSRAQRGTGNALANVLTGNALDNILDGRAGADRMAGGLGNDTYVVDVAGDNVTELANEGVDIVESRVSYTLGAHVENLTLTGSAAINGTGNALENVLRGNGGANVLKGLGGDDTYFAGAGDSVVENAGQGTDTVHSAISHTLAANVENLVLTGDANIDGTGNGLANVITGNAGANTLDGRAGADTVRGGGGDDTYVFGTGDVIVENAGEGTDLVRSSVSYVLPDNVENLTLTGNAAVNGTGNALANVITGNAGNNVLDGAGGVDTMVGGAGNDTYIVDQGDATNASTLLRLEGQPGSYVAEGATFNFTPADGTFTINVLDMTVDTLADGVNVFYSDASNFFFLDVRAGTIPANLTPGFYADAQRASFAEPGHPGLDLGGNGAGANTVAGNFTVHEAVFDSSSGLPALVSFSVTFEFRAEGTFPPVFGRFNYNYSEGGLVPESVVELPNEGNDTVRSSITYTLPDNVENLVLTGAGAINGTGNALDNVITGNDAANVLAGGGGTDRIATGGGADTVVVGPLGLVRVTDFTPGAGGDMLDVQMLLSGHATGWDPATSPFDSGFLRLRASGADTLLEFDADGSANGASFVTLGRLQGVGAASLVPANFLLPPTHPPGTIVGTSGDDILVGDGTNNLILGLEGNDQLSGGGGDDQLEGGPGDDLLVGEQGNDTLIGGAGFNNLHDHEGENHFIGGPDGNHFASDGATRAIVEAGDGPGNNINIHNNGFAHVKGGSNADAIGFSGNGAGSIVEAGDGGDSVFVDNPSAENFIHTGAGGDHLHLGGVGTATTGADGDTIHLFYGTYDVDAGEGDDTFFLHASWAPHEITLGAGSDRLKVINWQQIANVEDFTVGPGGDVLDLSSALLVTATEDNIAEIVGFTPDVSGGTIVSIDPDASGSESAFTFSVFHNTSGLDAVDMFNNGNIYVV